MKLMFTKHMLIKTMWIKAMFKYVDENHVDRHHVDQKHVGRNHVDRNHVDQNNVDKNNVDKNHFRSHGCTCSVHPWQAIARACDRSRDLILSTVSQRILRGRDLILICVQGGRTVVEKVVH